MTDKPDDAVVPPKSLWTRTKEAAGAVDWPELGRTLRPVATKVVGLTVAETVRAGVAGRLRRKPTDDDDGPAAA